MLYFYVQQNTVEADVKKLEHAQSGATQHSVGEILHGTSSNYSLYNLRTVNKLYGLRPNFVYLYKVDNENVKFSELPFIKLAIIQQIACFGKS